LIVVAGPPDRSGSEFMHPSGWVSAEQLRVAPPLGHLYAYLLASNFLVAMPIPVAITPEKPIET